MVNVTNPISARDIKIFSIRDYITSRSYVFREPWGPFLDRYSKKTSGREDNILVPKTIEIADFQRRMLELVDDLSTQLKKPPNIILKEISNSGYEVVRIRANEGDESNTLSYDSAIDLLQGGFALIDSSAVSAILQDPRGIIRGRRPDVVRNYLDTVRVGQTEVGSFILTLLMPTAAPFGNTSLESGNKENAFGSAVARTLITALHSAEQAVQGKLAVSETIIRRGLTANFSGGLARMVEAVGNVSLTIGTTPGGKSERRSSATRFTHDDSVSLRAIERELTPVEQRGPLQITGTVTEFKEARGKVSGTILVSASIFGDQRGVRVNFPREERDKILESIANKGEVELAVQGNLVEKSGHLRLEEAKDFRVLRKNILT